MLAIDSQCLYVQPMKNKYNLKLFNHTGAQIFSFNYENIEAMVNDAKQHVRRNTFHVAHGIDQTKSKGIFIFRVKDIFLPNLVELVRNKLEEK